MMMNFLYFKLFLFCSIQLCYSQNDNSVDFEYFNISLDEFDAFKYEKLKTPKLEIAKKFNVPLNLINKDSLSIRENIFLKSLIGNISIVKFYDHKTLVLKNNQEANNLLKDDLVFVLSKIDLEAFLSFFSSKDDEKYSNLNKFKGDVKNEKGDLDIDKLAQIIKQNKSDLSEYLD